MRKLLLCLTAAVAVAGCTSESDHPISSAVGSQAQPARAALATAIGRATVRSSVASLPDRGALLAFDTVSAPSSAGATTLYPIRMSEAHALNAAAPGRAIDIATPDGKTMRFAYASHTEDTSGNWTWVGNTMDGLSAVITFGEDAVFGQIALPGAAPLQLTTRNGRTWLGVIDSSRALSAHLLRKGRPDVMIPRIAAAAGATLVGPKAAPAQPGFAVKASATNTVDLLLGYTPGLVASYNGSVSAVNTRLTNLVAVTNAAYQRSQVTPRVRLVHTMQVNYTDTNSNDAALAALTGFNCTPNCTPASVPAELQPLRNARDQYGADLVSLVRPLRAPQQDGCGIAWVNGGGENPIDNTYAPFGYSVVGDGQDLDETDGNTYLCYAESLAHELGHNMGQAHNIEDAEGQAGTHSYSYGYREASTVGFFTIMAYPPVNSSQYPISYFANPSVNDTATGRPTGTASANNALSLNQSMPLVAQFRAAVVPSGDVRLRDDVNGDGRSDIVWYHGPTQTLAYWIMNGATLASSGGQVIGSNNQALSTGDYNGDGRADVLVRTPTGELRMFIGDGSSFTGATVATYPSGWQVIGSEDVDADGRADIVWYHGPTQTLAFWAMNGATVVRTGGQVIGSNNQALSTGDYNGDGRADVLIRTPTGELRMFIGDGNTFTGSTVATYPSGWQVIGSQDVDADGRSDIVWYHGPTQTLAYWIMNGASVARTGGQVIGSNNQGLATGDYNGDGRADVLIRSPNGELRMFIGDGNLFSGATVATYPSGWQVVGSRKLKDIRDVDGDEKSDFVWFHQPSQTLAFWIMNVSTQVRTGGQSLGAGHTALSTGDYNGDGLTDAISRTSGGALWMWISTGTGFTGTNIGTYPAGWDTIDSSDVDGDGKSDIVFFHPPSQTLGYWIMNATTVMRTGGQAITGYTALSAGDFNGDGLADLASRGTAGDLRLWISTGTGFIGTAAGTFPAGWELLECPDVDGDGKSDIVYFHAPSQTLGYWIMNAGAVVRTGGAALTGYTAVAAGDYNGDGIADVIARGGAGDIRMWIGNGNTFTGQAAGTYPGGWVAVK